MNSEKKFLIFGDEYINLRAAARSLAISERHMHREITCRRIRTLKHTKGYLFKKEWLAEWVERRTTKIK